MKTCWYKYCISMNNFGLFFFNLKDFLEMILQNFIFEAYIWTERLSSSFAELTKKSMKLAILSLSLSLSQYNI